VHGDGVNFDLIIALAIVMGFNLGIAVAMFNAALPHSLTKKETIK
jgi:hypothetical protein